MAFIDSDGLFNGDRMALLSDEARFAWPYFWCASNTMGRVELSYRKFAVNVFGRFHQIPDEQKFWSWVREFADAFLLFVYENAGQIWGQWDASERFLPHYKLTADRNTPAPDPQAYTQWRERYIETKRKKVNTTGFDISVLLNSQKSSSNVPESSKGFSTESYGVGVGVGEEIKPATATAPPNGSAGLCGSLPSVDDPPFETTDPDALFPVEQKLNGAAKPDIRQQWQHERFTEFWSVYWLHRDRKQAERAFAKAVRSQTKFDRVMAAVKAQRPEMLARDKSKRPYGATWLNGERWEDELSEPAGTPPAAATDDYPELPQ